MSALPGPALPQQIDSGEVCVDRSGAEPVDIYYELYHIESSTEKSPARNGPQQQRASVQRDRHESVEPIRMLFLMGFAASGSAWYPLLRQLKVLWTTYPGRPIYALLVDNRGVGKSSSPKSNKEYSTTRMAMDALAVMDHLSWQAAHVVGWSMGGMIAIKLGGLAPKRVHSLAVLSVTGGGMQAFPRSWKAIKNMLKIMVCASSVEDRVHADLVLHYSKATLKRVVPGWGVSVRDVLASEYKMTMESGRPQPAWGFKGQAHAIWKNHISEQDVHNIKATKFPLWFIHGRNDVVAPSQVAEKLAARFAAPCVFFGGAHFVPRENAYEVAVMLRMLTTISAGGPLGAQAVGPEGMSRTSLDALNLQLMATAGVLPDGSMTPNSPLNETDRPDGQQTNGHASVGDGHVQDGPAKSGGSRRYANEPDQTLAVPLTERHRQEPEEQKPTPLDNRLGPH